MNTTTTELTQEEKRALIAKACGFQDIRIKESDSDDNFGEKYLGARNSKAGMFVEVPDYFNDLNACHEMEKQAPMGYGDEVRAVVARDAGIAPQHICDQYVICATAEQRAEAFGRIMHLWP